MNHLMRVHALSVFEITLLLITVLIGSSIVWSTLVLGISPMPSSNKARIAIMELSDGTGTGPIFELGSGWGHLLIPLARKYPDRDVVGYELSLFPWLTSKLLKKIFGLTNLHIHRTNFKDADLSDASVIVCYLFTGGMNGVEGKLQNGNAEYLISNNFSLPSYHALKTIYLDDLYRSPVYLYRFKPLV